MELLVLRWELAPEPATYCLANADALPAALHGPLVELVSGAESRGSTLHVPASACAYSCC